MMLRAFISVSKFVASSVESVAWTVAVPHTLAAAAIPTKKQNFLVTFIKP